jgi:hypothetical protein
MSRGTAALTAGDCGPEPTAIGGASGKIRGAIFRSMNETMPLLRVLRQTVANCPFDRIDLS